MHKFAFLNVQCLPEKRTLEAEETAQTLQGVEDDDQQRCTFIHEIMVLDFSQAIGEELDMETKSIHAMYLGYTFAPTEPNIAAFPVSYCHSVCLQQQVTVW